MIVVGVSRTQLLDGFASTATSSSLLSIRSSPLLGKPHHSLRSLKMLLLLTAMTSTVDFLWIGKTW